MADKDALLDSDESDDDYVPEEKTGNVSEEVDSGDAESDIEQELNETKAKRRRRNPDPEETKPQVKEESKIDVNALWSDFKKDADETAKKALLVKSAEQVAKVNPLPTQPTPKPNLLPTTSKGGGGLANVLGKLGKKDKLSTLEKSKLDWNNFKRAEGIEEDLQTHNRGKGGYLERRDFLERTDLRQYQLEKELRTLKRSTR